MLKPPAILLILAAGMPMSGCSDQGGGEPQHYLKLTGGGIVFNYRIANTYAGVLVSAERALPEGSIVEASFDNPAGGPRFEQSEPVTAGKDQFTFQFEPINGIKANVDYTMAVRLIDKDGNELDRIERAYRSPIDQVAVMPTKPLTVGPGYTRNPEATP